MKYSNKTIFLLFALGIIAIIVGSISKINGNPNAYIQLWLGLMIEAIALILFFMNNNKNLSRLWSDTKQK